MQLLNINTDILIIPNHARRGFVLLEETKPSRLNEFYQCINDNQRQLNINIDEKYGDLVLNQTVENLISNQPQQQLLCTIHRNEVNSVFFIHLKSDLIKLFDDIWVFRLHAKLNIRNLMISRSRDVRLWKRLICLIDVYIKRKNNLHRWNKRFYGFTFVCLFFLDINFQTFLYDYWFIKWC